MRGSDRDGGTGCHDFERMVGGARGGPGGGERMDGVIAALGGELKGAPVPGEAGAGPRVLMAAHRLGGIQVHRGHEPARLIGANGHEREVGGAGAAADGAKQLFVVAGFTEKPEVAGVPSERENPLQRR